MWGEDTIVAKCVWAQWPICALKSDCRKRRRIWKKKKKKKLWKKKKKKKKLS